MATTWVAAPAARADYLDDIGYRALVERNVLLARGAGQLVVHVEAETPAGSNQFAPDRSDAQFAGKLFLGSGATSGAVSAHATWMGRTIYGNTTGVAPGVTQVTVLDTDGFLTGSALGTGSASPPYNLNASVINNSWVAAYVGDDARYNEEALRRLDWMIDRDDVVVVSAVDNDSSRPFPQLLAPAYNGIAVGVTARTHTTGPITIDTPAGGQRAKPDLVVPVARTSEAAAVVSGAAALLRSEGAARGMDISALETKALLMAAAQRTSAWRRGTSGRGDDTTTPLDFRMGAGYLRVDRAFDLMMRGERTYGSVPSSGFAEGVSRHGGEKRPRTYTIRLNEPAAEMSAVLTWNREVEPAGFRDGMLVLDAELANLNLALQRRTEGEWRTIAFSRSEYDNVETLTLASLRAGTYRLVVTGDVAEEYALAWRTRFGGGPGVTGAGVLKVPTAPAPTVLAAATGGGATAVPEPSSAALTLAGATALGLLRRRRSRGGRA